MVGTLAHLFPQFVYLVVVIPSAVFCIDKRQLHRITPVECFKREAHPVDIQVLVVACEFYRRAAHGCTRRGVVCAHDGVSGLPAVFIEHPRHGCVALVWQFAVIGHDHKRVAPVAVGQPIIKLIINFLIRVALHLSAADTPCGTLCPGRLDILFQVFLQFVQGLHHIVKEDANERRADAVALFRFLPQTVIYGHEVGHHHHIAPLQEGRCPQQSYDVLPPAVAHIDLSPLGGLVGTDGTQGSSYLCDGSQHVGGQRHCCQLALPLLILIIGYLQCLIYG